MKLRMIAWILCCAAMAGILTGCAQTNTLETTAPETPKYTQPPEEAAVLKVLSIGNSHSQDSVWLFQEVLRKEMPQQQVMIVELLHSSAMPEHLSFAMADEAVYEYCVNTDGKWVVTKNYTIAQALTAEMWDYVIINESSRYLGLEQMMNKGVLGAFIAYIEKTLPNPAQLLYNWTWSAPTDEAFYSLSWEPQPPGSFREVYTRDYGFDRVQHYEKMQKMLLKYVQPHEKINGILYSATTIQYATEVLNIPQTEMYRDYTHLSDYGRLFVGYLWYAQIMELDSLTEIHVDVIPEHVRHWRYDDAGDVNLTQQQKQWILDAVNYTLKNPLQMPTA